jgi:hypothetical protein
MTTITGKINGSVNGIIRATPDHIFIDNSTNPKTLVMLPIEAAIANGSFTINVPQSQNLAGTPNVTTEGITWYFEQFRTVTTSTFYFLDGIEYKGATHLWATDGLWYTGSVHVANSQRLDKVDRTENLAIASAKIHAVVPDVASIDFSALVGIPAEQPYLNISLYRIAELLTTIAVYRDRISSKFTPKGAYSAATAYVYGDLINYNGNSYVWVNSASLTGQTPPATNNANWFQIASKGAVGGTGAQIVGFSPITWQGSAEAAARGDVRDAIASVQPPDLSGYLTIVAGLPRNNAVMTGTSKRAALSFPVATAEKATEISTAQYVEDAIAALGVGLLPRPIVWTRRTSDQIVCNNGSSSGNVRVAWDSTLLGSANMSGGIFTVPTAGNYLFYVNLNLQLQPNSATEPTKSGARAYLSSLSVGELEGFFRTEKRLPYTVSSLFQGNGLVYLSSLSAATQIEVRANIYYSNGATAYSDPSEIIGGSQNNLIIWRVA